MDNGVFLNQREKEYLFPVIKIWRRRTKKEFRFIVIPNLFESGVKIFINRSLVCALNELADIEKGEYEYYLLEKNVTDVSSYVFLNKNLTKYKLKSTEGFYEF